MKNLLLAVIFLCPAIGESKTLLTCGKDEKESTYFELRESATEFEFEFRETPRNLQNSVAYSLVYSSVKVGRRYHTVVKTPKKPTFGAASLCSVTGTIFLCSGSVRDATAQVVDAAAGVKFPVRYIGSLSIYNEQLIEEWVSGWQELESRKSFSLISYFQGYQTSNHGLECSTPTKPD